MKCLTVLWELCAGLFLGSRLGSCHCRPPFSGYFQSIAKYKARAWAVFTFPLLLAIWALCTKSQTMQAMPGSPAWCQTALFRQSVQSQMTISKPQTQSSYQAISVLTDRCQMLGHQMWVWYFQTTRDDKWALPWYKTFSEPDVQKPLRTLKSYRSPGPAEQRLITKQN